MLPPRNRTRRNRNRVGNDPEYEKRTVDFHRPFFVGVSLIILDYPLDDYAG